MAPSKKILLVDDDKDILEFLTYNFKKSNFDVVTAENGLDGITAAEEQFPDIIISDVLMPKMDGIEMTKNIKKKAMLKYTPTIILSAINNEFKVLNSLDSGADEFVSKPIKYKDLLKIVNRVLTENGLGLNFSFQF